MTKQGLNIKHRTSKKQKSSLASIVLRIGVTGHRTEPDELPLEERKRSAPNIRAIRLTIQKVLEDIRVYFDYVAYTKESLLHLAQVNFSQHSKGTLRIISGLASGADQWVAEEAIKLGYELHSILPFDKNEYRKDFTPQVEAISFEKLLNESAFIFELDGKVVIDKDGIRKPDNQSYETVAKVILTQIDLLIAVWDGKESHGLGGTGQVVKEALQLNIPVIWIPWDNPEKWEILGNSKVMNDDLFGEGNQIAKVIREIFNLQTNNNLNNSNL